MENIYLYLKQNHKTFLSTIKHLYGICSPTLNSIVYYLESQFNREVYKNSVITEQQVESFLENLIAQKVIIFIADECGKTIPIPVEWIKGILRYHLAMSECSHGSLFQMIQRRYRIGQVTTRAIVKWIVDNGYVSRIFFPSHPLSYCFVTDHQYNDFLKEYCLRW